MVLIQQQAHPITSAIGRSRIVELDGLRAFAILPVLLHHLAATHGWGAYLYPISQIGWMGVDLFFVLSGFLITSILISSKGQPHYYRNFIVRRALRIFPLYYFCLPLFTAGAYFMGDGTYWSSFAQWGGPWWFVCYLGNVRAAFMNALPPATGFGPLWSLQVEEQFYLIYPLAVLLLWPNRLKKVLLGCIVCALAMRCLSVAFFPVAGEVGRYVLTPMRMDTLAIGGILAILMWEGSLARYARFFKSTVLAGITLLAAIVIIAGPSHSTLLMSSIGYSIISAVCASVLGLVLLSSKAQTRVLRWTPLVYTGQIAYGLYILHGPAQWLARAVGSRIVPFVQGDSLNLVAGMVAAYSVAAISWHLFESKVLAFKQRFTSPAPDSI